MVTTGGGVVAAPMLMPAGAACGVVLAMRTPKAPARCALKALSEKPQVRAGLALVPPRSMKAILPATLAQRGSGVPPGPGVKSQPAGVVGGGVGGGGYVAEPTPSLSHTTSPVTSWLARPQP